MPRTAGATNISDKVKELIDREATENPFELRATVVARLQRAIEECGERVPPEETLFKKVSEARKRRTPKDDPWSLGVQEPEIPPDAIGDLLAVWKESLKVGWTFTIRQARWAARLRTALPDADAGLLFKWAVLYSRRERTAERQRPQRQPDTADLDAELAFRHWESPLHEWEYEQAVLVGAVPPATKAGGFGPRLLPRALWSFPIPLSFFLWQGRGFLREVGGIEINRAPWWPHAESVMAFWLREISTKVKKWQGIDEDLGGGGLPGDKKWEEWEAVGRHLAALVIEEAIALERYVASAGEREKYEEKWWRRDKMHRVAMEHSSEEAWGKLEDMDRELFEEVERLPKGYWETWKPTELLKEVGYEK